MAAERIEYLIKRLVYFTHCQGNVLCISSSQWLLEREKRAVHWNWPLLFFWRLANLHTNFETLYAYQWHSYNSSTSRGDRPYSTIIIFDCAVIINFVLDVCMLDLVSAVLHIISPPPSMCIFNMLAHTHAHTHKEGRQSNNVGRIWNNYIRPSLVSHKLQPAYIDVYATTYVVQPFTSLKSMKAP